MIIQRKIAYVIKSNIVTNLCHTCVRTPGIDKHPRCCPSTKRQILGKHAVEKQTFQIIKQTRVIWSESDSGKSTKIAFVCLRSTSHLVLETERLQPVERILTLETTLSGFVNFDNCHWCTTDMCQFSHPSICSYFLRIYW